MMNGAAKLVLLVAAFLACGPAHAETTKISDDLADVVAAAKQEGSINIIWSSSAYGEERQAQDDVAAMNRMFGTNLAYRFAPGDSMPEQGNKLFTEYKAGQPSSSDLFISAPLALTELIHAGLFVEVPWTKLSKDRIPPEIVEAHGQVMRFDTAITVVPYNTDEVPQPPSSLKDLLAPEWKGKIATTGYAAGFDVLLASDFWGVNRTLAYVKDFLPQVAGLIRCGDEERIATGEFALLALECTSQGAIRLMARGAPINYFVPSDAAQLRYHYFAIPRNAAHPNAAVLLGLYFMSPEGQAAAWRKLGYDLDVFPESESGKVVRQYQAKGVTFKRITAEWWMQHPEIGETMPAVLKLFAASK